MTTTTERTERAQLADRIHEACWQAKQEVCVIGTSACPSGWDESHEFLNVLLSEWQAAE